MFLIRLPKFPLGRLVATPGVLAAVPKIQIQNALDRHAHGDWGIIPDENKRSNDQALQGGGRLFSAYLSTKEVRFWIITEQDRSATTVLLPEEY